MIKYIKKVIKLNEKMTNHQIVNLCHNENTYCLYEKGKEISIGIGKYLDICVTRHLITITSEFNRQEIPVKDLCIDLKEVLDNVALDDWRLYGTANFSLARYTYGLDTGKEEEILLHMFIPQKEYRIKGEEVVLKSFSERELSSMEEVLQKAILLEDHVSKDIMDMIIVSDAIVNYDEKYYKEIVKTGVGEITNGDYQKVILSRKIPIDSRLDMKKTYVLGRNVNTPARSYLCKIDDLEIVGFSPETVAEVDKEGLVYTLPLAGTRALTKDTEENSRLKEELIHDTKEIAEHAVSVKLAEEELQQICEKDSVVVTEFMSIMERGTVQHLGSRLRGKMKESLNSWHALCKLFPAVTASGIPKKEAIEAIGRIEKEGRGLYSGSVLIADKNGYLDAALVLRSIFQDKENTWTRVGAGIVKMSNPEREFTETQEKVNSVALRLVTN